ncbi:hypothetical protein HDU93_003231 [Gonapodya sp. JEL0774]|nr:hypothetical protein HDU93_003231 [Gonapodya sp. JEL0774]
MGSRIIVKNLPRHITQERFKDIFSAKGTVTDVKLVKTGDGVFRRFGYIGYSSEREAKAAVEYFNNTYIDTSKITVEAAKSPHDPSLPRAWSKHTAGTTAHLRANPSNAESQVLSSKRSVLTEHDAGDLARPVKRNDVLGDLEGDGKLTEFLEVVGVGKKGKTKMWQNDDGVDVDDGVNGLTRSKAKKARLSGSEEDGTGPNLIPSQAGTVDGTATKSTKKAKRESSEDFIGDETDGPASKKQKLSAAAPAQLKATFMSPPPLPPRDNDAESDDELYADLPMAAPKSPEPEPPIKKSKQKANKSNESQNEMTDQEYMQSKMRRVLDERDEVGEPTADMEESEEDEDQEPSDTDGEAEPTSPRENIKSDLEAPVRDTSQTDDDLPPVRPASFPLDPPTHPEGLSIPPPPELIAETGRLYIRNLPYTASEDEIRQELEAFGPLAELHMPISRVSRRPTGTAFALYVLPEHAVVAYESLNMSIFQGRILDVVAGREKPPAKDDVATDAKSSFKREREKRRKGEGDTGWNSLFMNSDAVLESIAKKLGVTKAEILNPEAGNMAVRVAMAETHVISETKQYLEEEGISLTCFDNQPGKSARSNTVILVKNLPAATREAELVALFSPLGPLGRVVFPPTRTVALVEFAESNDAKKAFRTLAYKNFHGVPLYLEWAPSGVFKEALSKEEIETRRKKRETEFAETKAKGVVEREGPEAVRKDDGVTAAALDGLPTSTVFVKNLSFTTTDATLAKAFSGIGQLKSARVATKPDPKNPRGPRLSMGFGFVEFGGKEFAMKAIKAMQGFVLDGHAVELKMSDRGSARDGDNTSKRGKQGTQKLAAEATEPKGTKLLVRNVPFQGTKRELRALFASFGHVKSVRMPKKFDGSHRGFAFVDFLTRQEAKNAFLALAGTHFYGRHLVCEWAEEEESVHALREKEGRKFNAKGKTDRSKNLTLEEDEGLGAGGGDGSDGE